MEFAANHLGGLDIVVNNAGFGGFRSSITKEKGAATTSSASPIVLNSHDDDDDDDNSNKDDVDDKMEEDEDSATSSLIDMSLLGANRDDRDGRASFLDTTLDDMSLNSAAS